MHSIHARASAWLPAARLPAMSLPGVPLAGMPLAGRSLPGMSSLAVSLLAAALLGAPAAAQLHKDEIHGFQFSPPRDYNAVALNPSERLQVAKYQSSEPDYVGEQGYTKLYRTLIVMYMPLERFDDEDDLSPEEEMWELVDVACGRGTFSEKETTIAKTRCTERTYSSEQESVERGLVTWVLPQDDGMFAIIGEASADKIKKAALDFSKSAKSFKRIEKTDAAARDAELGQLSDQDRFLQEQIDKLPPGWDHLRTARYLFLYNAEKSFVKELAEQIEAMRDEYERLWVSQTPIDAVSIVRVCNSHDEYIGYGGRPGTGGYWASAHKELVFFDMAPRTETLCVARHEAFHQYIYYFYGELAPHSWYNEGHGDYFSGARMTRSNRITKYASAPGGYDRSGLIKDMARLAKQGKRVSEGAAAPLADLLRFHQPEYYARGPERPVAYYPQGWAFVHMLRESRGLKERWASILDDYLENLLAARDVVAQKVMEKAKRDAEKKKEGSSAEMSSELKDYYGDLDQNEVQDEAYARTFGDWSDTDWAEFDAFFLEYCEKL